MQTSAAPKYLNKRQLAEILGISVRTLERHVESGALPRPVRIGRGPQPRQRWLLDEVQAALRGSST